MMEGGKREIHYTLCEPKMNQNQFTKPGIKCQRGKTFTKDDTKSQNG
jgi:hypothetical protein